MQQLASNNFEKVVVQLRDETITMPADKGSMLMQYLTGDNISSHVMITDVTGVQIVVNKSDIRKVSPIKSQVNLKSPQELGMNDENRSERGEGYKKYMEIRNSITSKKNI